jgi:hypothetical protein
LLLEDVYLLQGSFLHLLTWLPEGALRALPKVHFIWKWQILDWMMLIGLYWV